MKARYSVPRYCPIAGTDVARQQTSAETQDCRECARALYIYHQARIFGS
jgi:hypothetical protein